jgi:LacI family transcriptional regulator
MSSDRKRVLYYPDRKQVVQYGERYGLYTEQGIVDFALQAGWLLTIVSDEAGHLAPALQLVNASRYDGLITITPESDSAIGKIMKSAAVPALNLFDSGSELNLPKVLTDNHAIGRLGADHLMDQGIEYLAFIRAADDRQTRERAQGFQQQVELRGRTLLRLDPTEVGLSVLNRSADRERVPWLASQLLRLPRPLGVMIPTDTLYWHIIEACAAASVRIPEDVAVASVGNIESLCKLSEPALTSVDPHYRRLGYEAAALLDRMMNGASAPISPLRVPPGHVEIRESTDIYAVDDKTLRAVLRFMRTNFRDHSLSVDDIVKASGTSRRNLYWIFEYHWPRSIAETLAEFRVLEAKRLLATTDLKQFSVAVQSGFSSETQMSRAFSKRLGITPGTFRLENRPGSDPA